MKDVDSMNPESTNVRWTPLSLLAFSLIGCGVVSLLVIIIGYASGRGILGNDAYFEEFHVCLDEIYQPISSISTETQTFYLCGIIAGNGLRQGVWYIYKDEQMFLSRYFEHFPGTFFERISFEDNLTVGVYRIRISSEKHLLAETEFTVLSGRDAN
jgi:hypothetical protein